MPTKMIRFQISPRHTHANTRTDISQWQCLTCKNKFHNQRIPSFKVTMGRMIFMFSLFNFSSNKVHIFLNADIFVWEIIIGFANLWFVLTKPPLSYVATYYHLYLISTNVFVICDVNLYNHSIPPFAAKVHQQVAGSSEVALLLPPTLITAILIIITLPLFNFFPKHYVWETLNCVEFHTLALGSRE